MEYQEFSNFIEENTKASALYGKFAKTIAECIGKLTPIMEEAEQLVQEAETNVTNLMASNREYAKRWVAKSIESGKFQELFAHEQLKITKKTDGVYDMTWEK